MRIFVLIAFMIAAPLGAVDRDFLRAWERAQRNQPDQLSRTAAIAGDQEPGERLVIDGQVLVDGGRAAVRDAIVFAWQTDATGVYDEPGSAPHSWRLRGWARTDENGRFRFTTVRPAPYPNGVEPAHVHFTVTRRNGTRYFVRDLNFAGDPLLERASSRGSRGYVAEVRRDGSVQYVDVALELEDDNRF